MNKFLKLLALGLIINFGLSWQIAIASGTLITDLIGDKDCFGLGGVCSDGDHYFADLGGIGADNRSPGEVLGVDQFGTSVPLGGPSFTFGLDLGGATPVSASLTIFTAGIDLVGATFFFNGTNIGFHLEGPGQENRAATVVLNVPVSLLSNPDNLTLSVPDLGLVQDGFIIDYVELTVETTTPLPEPVTIDIKPGSDPNSINPASRGKIPVAILTTDIFDATQVDVSTVAFGPNAASESHGRSHVKDIDGDGDMDLVLHFNTQDTGIQCGDTDATLTGETFGGQAITGSDAINTVRCP